jgi:thiol-disulfide isomerase/thioredoxin
VLAGVIGIAAGFDTGLLTRLTPAGTSRIERRLVDRIRPLRAEGRLPDLAGATAWLQSPPLTTPGLRGRVVLVDFWTYSCINCVRSVPYVQAWFDKYQASGLVVIGVHTPEFAFERDLTNVGKAVRDLHLTYPVAIDNGYAIWKAFDNEYWPAHYLVDTEGIVRHHHFGEGGYEETEHVIQQLLAERWNAQQVPAGTVVPVTRSAAQAPPSLRDVRSPETYVGYERQVDFTSPEPIRKDVSAHYTLPARLHLNDWGLAGVWRVGREEAQLADSHGSTVFRFHARDLHLVLGPGAGRRAVRFRVRIDGAAPGADAGGDVEADGSGLVTDYRVYQLIRQTGPVVDRTFEIEFLDSGVQVFAFTFG